jgi:hypothetical protein
MINRSHHIDAESGVDLRFAPEVPSPETLAGMGPDVANLVSRGRDGHCVGG